MRHTATDKDTVAVTSRDIPSSIRAPPTAGVASGTALGAAAPLAASTGALGAGLHLLGVLPPLGVPSALRLQSLDLDVGRGLRARGLALRHARARDTARELRHLGRPRHGRGAAFRLRPRLRGGARRGGRGRGRGATRTRRARGRGVGPRRERRVPAASGALLFCGGTFGLLRLVPS
jgi:hypothetical protein